jgi:hypothetical protein
VSCFGGKTVGTPFRSQQYLEMHIPKKINLKTNSKLTKSRPWRTKLSKIKAGQNFTVFIFLLASFPIVFGALFTVAVPSAPVHFWNTLSQVLLLLQFKD